MTGNKDLASIVSVLDQNIWFCKTSKINRSIESRKEMDKVKMLIEGDYSRISGESDQFAGWKNSNDEYSKNRHSKNRHSKNRHSRNRHSKDRYSNNRYLNNRHSKDGHSKNEPKYKKKREVPKPPRRSSVSPTLNRSITWSKEIKFLNRSASASALESMIITGINIPTKSTSSLEKFSTLNKSLSSPDLSYIKKEKIIINAEIDGLKDLLKLIKENPLIDNAEYNIDMKTMHNIITPLKELERMIGMRTLKDNVVDQIIYYVQNFHKLGKCEGDFMHTVIYGPPGTGKTEIAKIIGRIFSRLGILTKGTFRKVTRADLIAGYLGQTAIKTKDVIKECLGGVLFIDEAYALGNSEKRDSFAKECIDTLCEALSDYKDNIMVIIAGYEKELKSCFFNYNEGLESRFTWRFKTDEYTAGELKQIFFKKIEDAGWNIDKDTIIKEDWFKNNMDYFKYYGRDMETLFAKTKICHSRRVFCKSEDQKTYLTMQDIEKGFELYIKNDEVKSRKDNEWTSVKHMYS